MRPDKNTYYLGIAKAVAMRGTCLRRIYGSVIVNNDQIVGTGYCGSPRGEKNCCDIGVCKREELNVPHGERYELCCSVHSEQNAIMNAGRERCIGASLYIAGIDVKSGEVTDISSPCEMCMRMIKNSGISEVYLLLTDGYMRITDDPHDTMCKLSYMDRFDDMGSVRVLDNI